MRACRFVIFCLVFLIFAPAYAQNVTFPTAPLEIKAHEDVIRFTVEVAITEEQQKQGLMYRMNLPDRRGMLFLFTPPQPVTFWMKNTILPLDMLFIDGHGIITKIAQNTPPESTDLIPSDGEVGAVLELKGGTAAQYHIASGDKVIYPLKQ